MAGNQIMFDVGFNVNAAGLQQGTNGLTQLQNSSKELYEEFERLELPRLTGKNCELVLTKTYMKTQINSKQFLTDFKPDSKMYQKYVEQKPVKGHLSLKRLNG